MSESKEILLVTNEHGAMHIVPTGNEDFYKSRNISARKTLYSMRTMSEEEAEAYIKQYKGIDPNFVYPSEVQKTLNQKNQQLEIARKALENQDAEIVALRKQLEEMSKQTFVKPEGTNNQVEELNDKIAEAQKDASQSSTSPATPTSPTPSIGSHLQVAHNNTVTNQPGTSQSNEAGNTGTGTAANEISNQTSSTTTSTTEEKMLAGELIEKIKGAKTEEELNQLISSTEERSTVLAAANKQRESIKGGSN